MSTQEKKRPAPTLGLRPDEIVTRYGALQAKLVPLWKSIATLTRDAQTIVVVPSITLDSLNMPLVGAPGHARSGSSSCCSSSASPRRGWST